MIRALRLAAVVLVGGVFGSVELVSMAVYGDLANPPAVPALLPASLGLAVARPLAAGPFPVALRTAAARALLHRGDVTAAAAAVGALPGTPDIWDLRGQLAERAGDASAALAAYARAGDLERAQRLIDAVAAAGRPSAAAALQTALAAALDRAGQEAIHGRALWRLGQLQQMAAVADADAAHRALLERAALRSYERALTFAPNDETYLLAAGRQELTLGDRAAAARYYRRALDAVPDSADARAGLAASGG